MCAPVGLERVGLAPAAIQGEHQLSMQALAQGLGGEGGLQLGHHLGVPPECELGIHARLERRAPRLLEPRDLGLGEALIRQVRERIAPPHAERLAQRGGGRRRVALTQLAPAGRERLEAVDVALAVIDAQAVGATARLEPPVQSERTAQRGDGVLDHLRRGGRRALAP